MKREGIASARTSRGRSFAGTSRDIHGRRGDGRPESLPMMSAALFNFFDRGLRPLDGGGERFDVGKKTVRFVLSMGNEYVTI
jgi:hypothetical protein